MKAPPVKAPLQLEGWATDGHRVWRAIDGPTVCVLGDPTQLPLFDDATVRLQDAALIVCAPLLASALKECADRLERCCHHTGTAAEYAHAAVKEYRQLLQLAHRPLSTSEGSQRHGNV